MSVVLLHFIGSLIHRGHLHAAAEEGGAAGDGEYDGRDEFPVPLLGAGGAAPGDDEDPGDKRRKAGSKRAGGGKHR